ncbi:MAG: hypothetical protein ACR2I2_00325, partial [Bryobacteraceae bacterium]
MTLEDSLHEQLLRSSRITAIVGARIWHGRLPPNSFASGFTQPALTNWRVIGRGFIPPLVKSGGGRPRFQLDCWSKADIGVWALRDAVRLELK